MTHLARLCWNSKGWTEPTGEARKLESNSYATQTGFGHEEWLFNPEALHEGWQYGFLQPVSKSRDKLSGKVVDVLLYSIGPKSLRVRVGRLPECQILPVEIAAAARERYMASGRLKRMEAQVQALEGDVGGLRLEDPRWLVNVRFRPETAQRFEPLVPVAKGDPLMRLQRYTLVHLVAPLDVIASAWPKAHAVTPLVPDTTWPDEVRSDWTTVEGASKQVMVNAYERDPRAREECLRHHGNRCSVCGMSFGDVYGEPFQSMTVHVHHLRPLALQGGARRIDPKEDLRPVCPNCHAVLHRRAEPYSIQEAKGFLGSAQSRPRRTGGAR